MHNLHLQLPCICHLAPAVVIIGHSFFVGLELGIEALDLGIAYGYRIEYAGITKVLLLAVLLVQIIARQISNHILLQLTHMRIGMIGNQMITELRNLQEYRSIAICKRERLVFMKALLEPLNAYPFYEKSSARKAAGFRYRAERAGDDFHV